MRGAQGRGHALDASHPLRRAAWQAGRRLPHAADDGPRAVRPVLRSRPSWSSPARAVVPGKLFADIVKNLPDAAVHVEADEDERRVITCDTASFSIKALNHEDFPGFPHVDVHAARRDPVLAVRVHGAARRRAWCRRTRAAPSSPACSSPSRTGRLEDGGHRLVPAGHHGGRAARRYAADEFQAVIAGSFLAEISSLPCRRLDAPVACAWPRTRSSSRAGDTVFINRRIEGQLPELHASCCPTATPRGRSIDGRAPSGFRREAHVAARPVLGRPGALRPERGLADGAAVCRAAQDVGSAQETIGMRRQKGEDAEIAFNYAYRAGRAGRREPPTKTFLEVQSSLKPGIFKRRRARELPVPRHAGAHRLMPRRMRAGEQRWSLRGQKA